MHAATTFQADPEKALSFRPSAWKLVGHVTRAIFASLMIAFVLVVLPLAFLPSFAEGSPGERGFMIGGFFFGVLFAAVLSAPLRLSVVGLRTFSTTRLTVLAETISYTCGRTTHEVPLHRITHARIRGTGRMDPYYLLPWAIIARTTNITFRPYCLEITYDGRTSFIADCLVAGHPWTTALMIERIKRRSPGANIIHDSALDHVRRAAAIRNSTVETEAAKYASDTVEREGPLTARSLG